MTFTGTLIDDLIAAVERAEQRAQSLDSAGAVAAKDAPVEPWLASAPDNPEFDSKFLGVA